MEVVIKLATTMPITPSVPQNLLTRIQQAIPRNPQLKDLFQDITKYIEESSAALQLQPNGTQPASKKRKLETDNDASGVQADTISDISFSIPQRKKLRLSLGKNSDQGSIRASNPSSNETEFGLRWSDVEYCVCLPVPEKAQSQYNFCIFPREGSDEQILFTVPGGNVKGDAIHSDVSFEPEESYKAVVIRMLNKRLKKKKVLEPDEREFASQVAQAHKKGEKAVHVKAFRGSKDGMSCTMYPSWDCLHTGTG